MYNKTYSIRLFPTADQQNQLMELIAIRNDIWNTLIDVANAFYTDTKKTLNNYAMHKEITILKQTIEKQHWSKLNAKAAQRVATGLFASYQQFFNNIKKNKPASLPNKLEPTVKKSIIFNQSGWNILKQNNSIDGNIIVINKIPFQYKSHIKNLDELNVKELKIKYRNDKWLCDLCVEYNETYPETIEPKRVLAIDLGLKNLGTGIDSNGTIVIIPNKAKKVSKHFGEQIAKIDTKISKKKKGSRRYKKLRAIRRKLFNKKNAQVKQTLHIQSKRIVNMNYHTIVIGDLSVKELMNKQNNNKKGVRKSFGQSNVSMFLTYLSYKSIGKTNIIKIDERHTTQLNSLTGKKFPEKIELKDRTVKLTDSIEIDRDLNSAINIYNRWYSNQIVPLTAPLDLFSVLEKSNLFKKT
jgi:putative transposase